MSQAGHHFPVGIKSSFSHLSLFNAPVYFVFLGGERRFEGANLCRHKLSFTLELALLEFQLLSTQQRLGAFLRFLRLTRSARQQTCRTKINVGQFDSLVA